jgi:ATP-dependent RNA helicase RhlE
MQLGVEDKNERCGNCRAEGVYFLTFVALLARRIVQTWLYAAQWRFNVSFEGFRLSAQIAANIKALGFETATPIQQKAIAPIMEGHDLIGLAQTGTGKTAAFVLPLLERLMKGPKRVVRGLIIAPTRELAEQINTVIRDLGRRTGIHSAAVYGGVGIGQQTTALRDGVEIVVACPGRLLDHMGRRTVDLSHVEYLVLDEADRLFDMGFMPDIRRILSRLPQRQTLLFSATMPNEIRRLTHDILKKPVTVEIALSTPVSSVTHALYPVSQPLKISLLLALLKRIDRDSVLIFTRTKHRAMRLADQLKEAHHDVACLQGDLSQTRRQSAMSGFRSGKHRILVATDIAARGIDVMTISHVINYDMPATVDAYTHRIGRTGRAAKTGDAFTFITPEDEGVIREIEKVLHCKLERRKLEGFNYTQIGLLRTQHAPAHHAAVPPHHATVTHRHTHT